MNDQRHAWFQQHLGERSSQESTIGTSDTQKCPPTPQDMMDYPRPSYKVKGEDQYDFKWKKSKNSKDLILRVSQGDASVSVFYGVMAILGAMCALFWFLGDLSIDLNLMEINLERPITFSDIIFYIIELGLFCFLIRCGFKNLYYTWIVFKDTKLMIFQNFCFLKNPRQVLNLSLDDVEVFVSDNVWGNDKKPIMTFGISDTYIYLYSQNGRNQFYKLMTYSNSTKATPHSEYLHQILRMQKARVLNIPVEDVDDSAVSKNITRENNIKSENLNECLSDIKKQLEDIENGLDDYKSKMRTAMATSTKKEIIRCVKEKLKDTDQLGQNLSENTLKTMALDVIQEKIMKIQEIDIPDAYEILAMGLETLSSIKRDLLNDSDSELKQQLRSLQTTDIGSENE